MCGRASANTCCERDAPGGKRLRLMYEQDKEYQRTVPASLSLVGALPPWLWPPRPGCFSFLLAGAGLLLTEPRVRLWAIHSFVKHFVCDLLKPEEPLAEVSGLITLRQWRLGRPARRHTKCCPVHMDHVFFLMAFTNQKSWCSACKDQSLQSAE